jgi:hypothetical protein
MVAVILIDARQRWADQLAIGEILFVRRTLDRNYVCCFFHSGVTPACAFAQTNLLEGPESITKV